MVPQSVAEGRQRMNELFKDYGVTPFTPIKGLFIQGPVFISFLFAIQNMVEKVQSLKSGGEFWFIDLTAPDSMYILLVLTVLTFLINVEAIFCYWITSNIFSFAYGFVLKIPGVKQALKIPEIPVVPPSSMQQNSQSGFSFFQAIKQASIATQNVESIREQPKPTELKSSSSRVLRQRLKTLERRVKQRKKSKK